MSTYIIAEAGVNHNGKKELAYKLIDKAVDAGVNAIKFQIFKAQNLVTEKTKKTNYQKKNTDTKMSQLEMLKQLELSFDIFKDLSNYCKKQKIDFLASAFDSESLNFIINDLKLDTLKIASGEITNGPLLLAHARSKKNIILSTGMANIKEIISALKVISFGIKNSNKIESIKSNELYQCIASHDLLIDLLKKKVTLLHCTSEYPAPFNEINLSSINFLKKKFGLPVGYSDHSNGIEISLAAAALGAKIVEKHFTLDRNLPGPDHKASIEYLDLKHLVKCIRNIDIAIGKHGKMPSKSELLNRDLVRKSIVTNQRIHNGEILTNENLAIKRPGNGISPMKYWKLIGKKAKKNYKKNELL